MVKHQITGMAVSGCWKPYSKGSPSPKESRKEYKSVLKRLDSVCHVAARKGASVFFDAEESWIQDSIDHLVTIMMRRYNRKRRWFTTRSSCTEKDRPSSTPTTKYRKPGGYLLSVKLVRGLYGKRARAEKMGYPSPIHPNKIATDDAYDVVLCASAWTITNIASCNASTTWKATCLLIGLISRKALPRNHPHLNFCQLWDERQHYFQPGKRASNVVKYVP